MQAPAWSRASCDLHLIFPSLCMVMWAPSHRGRGWIPEADHMLVEPAEVARNAVWRFKGCSCKAFPWWHLKINSCNPDTKFWVSSGPSALHWKSFAVNWQIICFCVSVCVLLLPFDIGHRRRKETRRTSLRTCWNPSWLMVYFVLWGRACTSCVCS